MSGDVDCCPILLFLGMVAGFLVVEIQLKMVNQWLSADVVGIGDLRA